jgi:methyl-accepting chemotaxis protein
MNVLNHFSISTKVWLAPASLLLLLALQGGLALTTMQATDTEVRVITEDLARDADLAGKLLADVVQLRLTVKNYLQSSDERYVEAFQQEEASSVAQLDKARATITDPQRQQLVTAIDSLHQTYSHTFENTVVTNMARRHALVQDALDANGPPMEDALSAIMESAHRDGDIEAGYQAGVAQRHLLLARLYVYKYLQSNDSDAHQRVTQELQILRTELAEMHETLENPDRRALSDAVSRQLAIYEEGFAGVVTAIEARNAGIREMDRIGPEIAAKAEALHDSVAQALAAQSERLHAELGRSELLVMAMLVLALLVGSGIAWTVSRAIIQPLRDTNRLLDAIAAGDGDLTARLPAQAQDEIGELARGFNRFVEKLQDIMGTVQASVSQLAAAAEELSTVTGAQQETIRQQVLETDQVATAVEEMSATLRDVARNVHETASAADQARHEVKNGQAIEAQALNAIRELGSDIQKTATVIDEVGRASEMVDTVVEVINGLAEQTNLLALNAAIEAARAGEQGRGFAVVADEVRTLAGRTRESTEQIRQTVEQLRDSARQAVERMNRGRAMADTVVDQAEQVDQALHGIVGSVEQIDAMTSQIATATEEQTAVAGEIARNVTNLKDQAGSAASATDQVGTAAEELARLATALQDEVGRFQVTRRKL